MCSTPRASSPPRWRCARRRPARHSAPSPAARRSEIGSSAATAGTHWPPDGIDCLTVLVVRQDGGHGRRPSGADLRARPRARRADRGSGTRSRAEAAGEPGGDVGPRGGKKQFRAARRRRRHRQDPRPHRAGRGRARGRPPGARRPLPRPRRQRHAVPAVRRGVGRAGACRTRRDARALAGARRSARITRGRRRCRAGRHPFGGGSGARHPCCPPTAAARGRGRPLGRRVNPSPPAVRAGPAVHQPGLADRQLPHRRPPPAAPAAGGGRGVVAAPGCPPARARASRRQRRRRDPALA